MIRTDSSAFRPIFTDLGGIDSVIRTNSSTIRPGFTDLGVLIKNSKSMIHTNLCVLGLVLHMFECISLGLLMIHIDSSIFNQVLHKV